LKLIIPVSNSAPPKADPALLKAIAHSLGGLMIRFQVGQHR